MKFTIEIDDESISEDNIKYEIASHIASKIMNSLNLKYYQEQANKDIEKKKEECLEGIKKELKQWDKSQLILDLSAMMEKTWITQVSDKIVEKLKSDPTFISKVSTEIIKTKFQNA